MYFHADFGYTTKVQSTEDINWYYKAIRKAGIIEPMICDCGKNSWTIDKKKILAIVSCSECGLKRTIPKSDYHKVLKPKLL